MLSPETTPLDAARFFFSVIPHGRAIGLDAIDVGENWVLAGIPWQECLVGNPATGHLHGGVITTVIDQTSGAAAIIGLRPPEIVATLDLRVDHLRAAEAGLGLQARAECYRTTRNIIFVRCTAWDRSPDDPVATSMSCFMRTGKVIGADAAAGGLR